MFYRTFSGGQRPSCWNGHQQRIARDGLGQNVRVALDGAYQGFMHSQPAVGKAYQTHLEGPGDVRLGRANARPDTCTVLIA